MKKVEKGKKNHIFKIFVCVNIKQIIILTKTKVTCFQLHIYPCFSFFLSFYAVEVPIVCEKI